MKKKKLLFAALLFSAAMTLWSCGGAKNENHGDDTARQETVDNPAMKALKKQVDELNSTMPIDMPGGLKITNVKLEDNYLTFTCEYPKTTDFTAPQDEAAKKTIIRGLPRPTLRALRQADLGIKYNYVKEGTDETQVVEISPETIKSI